MTLIDGDRIVTVQLYDDQYGEFTEKKMSIIDCINTYTSEGVTEVDVEQPKWIPVSEKLPEENGQYIITVKYKHEEGYEDIYTEHGDWNNGQWDMFDFGHCGEVEKILAWMPLPEPYKPQESED